MASSRAVLRPLADYHQVYLAPAEHTPTFDPGRPEVLAQVGADRVSIILVTGVAMGPVDLTVELLDDAPGDDPGASSDGAWEDSLDGQILLREPLYATAPTVDSGVPDPVVAPVTPGLHAFRVQARGRHDHVDEFVEESVETYRLRLWPVG